MIIEGAPPIQVTVKPNPRARRLSLRVSRLDGRVTLTLPPDLPVSVARKFVLEKEGWIRSQLGSQPEARRVGIGGRVALEGRELAVRAADGRGSIRVARGELLVPGDSGTAPRRIRAWLRQIAHDRLLEASDRHAATLGRRFGRITLRDTRSRWGSCSSKGDLMYSWRLVMAPPPVLDYVAAHEVAHLAHLDHSPAFWRVVGRLCPDHLLHRKWLRENAATLHRYRFED